MDNLSIAIIVSSGPMLLTFNCDVCGTSMNQEFTVDSLRHLAYKSPYTVYADGKMSTPIETFGLKSMGICTVKLSLVAHTSAVEKGLSFLGQGISGCSCNKATHELRIKNPCLA